MRFPPLQTKRNFIPTGKLNKNAFYNKSCLCGKARGNIGKTVSNWHSSVMVWFTGEAFAKKKKNLTENEIILRKKEIWRKNKKWYPHIRVGNKSFCLINKFVLISYLIIDDLRYYCIWRPKKHKPTKKIKNKIKLYNEHLSGFHVFGILNKFRVNKYIASFMWNFIIWCVFIMMFSICFYLGFITCSLVGKIVCVDY